MSDFPLRVEKRRGRPPNTTSEETRERLINSARAQFARLGFDKATMGDIARGADIVPSAVYRYFPDKESLYEAVFDASISRLWHELDAPTREQSSAAAALTALCAAADRAGAGLPDYPEFLRAMPLEATRNRQFLRLVSERNEIQRNTFRHIASLGQSTGELDASLEHDELSEQLRVIVMGWLVERNLHPDERRLSPGGLLRMLGLA